MFDLQRRLARRIQITIDGHGASLEAVEEAFGADVDCAQLVKIYGEGPEPKGRYSSPTILPPIRSGSRDIPILITSRHQSSNGRT